MAWFFKGVVREHEDEDLNLLSRVDRFDFNRDGSANADSATVADTYTMSILVLS